MALITYHQTLITFILFFSIMNEFQLLIRIINKVNRRTNEFSSPIYIATLFFIVPL